MRNSELKPTLRAPNSVLNLVPIHFALNMIFSVLLRYFVKDEASRSDIDPGRETRRALFSVLPSRGDMYPTGWRYLGTPMLKVHSPFLLRPCYAIEVLPILGTTRVTFEDIIFSVTSSTHEPRTDSPSPTEWLPEPPSEWIIGMRTHWRSY